MSEETYSLLLAFDSQSSEFVRGFEAACVYRNAEKFAQGEHPHNPELGFGCGCEPGTFTDTIHAANAEMVMRIAESFGLAVRSEEADDGFIFVTFKESGES